MGWLGGASLNAALSPCHRSYPPRQP